jgi:hypothetical protein
MQDPVTVFPTTTRLEETTICPAAGLGRKKAEQRSASTKIFMEGRMALRLPPPIFHKLAHGQFLSQMALAVIRQRDPNSFSLSKLYHIFWLALE